MNKLYTLALFSAILFAGCKSASKAYNQGNYANAIERGVKKLQKDPNDYDAKTVLQQAYKFAQSEHEAAIRNLSNSTDDNKWDRMYQQYNLLQKLYDNIHESPAAVQAVKPVDYSEQIRNTRNQAADAHYQKGLAFMNEEDNGDRTTYRQAYNAFRTALTYKPNDFDITRKLKEAKDSATIDVLITSISNFGGYQYTSATNDIRSFQNDLVRLLRNQMNSEFINLYTDWETRNTNKQPDEIIEMRFGAFTIGRPYDETKTQEVTKEVVVKEVVFSKDSVAKEYAKVTARITNTKRTLLSTAGMFLTIRDPRGRILRNDNVTSEHRWITEFATYNGDERALSESDKTQLNKKVQDPPREQDIVQQLLRKLQSDMGQHLRNYYTRY